MAHSAIKALSVAQPHAWALIHGPKRVENRNWRTPYEGKLVIHASKSREWLNQHTDAEWAEIYPGYPGREALDFGAFIGVTTLKGCFGKRDGLVIDPKYAEGPVCWITCDPLPLIEGPIPGEGQLCLFDVNDDVLEAVDVTLREAGRPA